MGLSVQDHQVLPEFYELIIKNKISIYIVRANLIEVQPLSD